MLIAIASLVGGGLVRAQAHQNNIDVDRDDESIIPGWRSLVGGAAPSFAREGSFTKTSKGFDMQLEGAATGPIQEMAVNTFGVLPGDFRGIAPIPKMMVEIGQEVEAGQPLFFDKKNPDIFYVSPVSGEVAEIKRGAKRSIAEVIILADRDQRYKALPSLDANADREAIVNYLKESGFWPMINARPFDVVADPAVAPRDIFISTFDSAPLAPSMDVIIDGSEAAFQAGLDVLSKLTDGAVHLGLDARGEAPSSAFMNATGVQKHWFNGKHPIGNVGIQIHHIAPIKPGHVVWTLTVEDVILLGNMVTTNTYQPTQIVAIGGNGAEDHKYVRTIRGANIGDLLAGQAIDEGEQRIIRGDVLSGKQASKASFLGAHDNQITVIPEGRNHEMFGWLLPAMDRPTTSRTYPNFLFGDLAYEIDTNTHGEPRAFVQTGQYESMMPADIYPQHLMKAIMIEDFEKMEGLGLLELSEEDIALCEFACTSKQPLQKILRQGLDLMREQG